MKKQCTICWYVDDNKASHVDKKVIYGILGMIKEHFGDIKVTRGSKHVFLGMNIEITPEKTIQIDMKDQLLEAIELFGEEINGKVSSITTHNLFNANDQVKPLDEKKKKINEKMIPVEELSRVNYL